MRSSALLAPPDLLGCEVPRLWTRPLRPLTPATSRGFEAIEFAEDVLGVTLLPWQKWLLIHALELSEDGQRFRFRTVVVLVARQNGKTLLLNVLTLWRMFVDYASLVIGTAQNLDVAEEAWGAAVDMAEGVPDLAAEIEAVDRVNGKKALRLTASRRYKVQAANRRGGRGLSGDLVALDELREHQKWDAWAAVTKTTNARPRPQVWCLSNAGDAASVVLNHLRSTALAQIAEGATDNVVGLFEWSAPEGSDKTDRAALAQANPSVGYLIPWDALIAAAETDPDDVFRVECMCLSVSAMDAGRITTDMWDALTDPTSSIAGAPVLAVTVRRDRSGAALTAAGRRADGMAHVELVEARAGTAWVVPRAVEVAQRHGASVVLAGPAVSLERDFIAAGVTPQVLGPAERARASAAFYDAVTAGAVRHLPDMGLLSAVVNARRRMVGDGWEWEAPDATVDILPVVGASAALWSASAGIYDPLSNIF